MAMTIRSRIIWINALVLAVTVAIGSVLVLTYRKVPVGLDLSEDVDDVVAELHDLDLALDDYYFRRQPRGHSQWETSAAQLEAHLDDLGAHEGVDDNLLVSLHDSRVELDALFARMPDEPLDEPTTAERRIHLQMRVRLHDMLTWSAMLSAMIDEELGHAQDEANVLIVVFALTIVLVAGGTVVFFQHTVLDPLERLEHGVESIGEGDFDTVITSSSTDELGHLTDVFNDMTCKLRELTRSREAFISTAVHEIKTPVAVIKTSVQLLQRMNEAQLEARMPEMLDRLDRQCNRLDRLVTLVLEVSRLEMKNANRLLRRETRLDELVERVVDEMSDVSARHELVLVDNEPITAWLDPDRIEQVLTNLIDNAIKYSPGGGHVEIHSVVEDDAVVISVRDDGIGIPDHKQQRLFERFYRAHAGTHYDHVTSLGVGLYLSNQFVHRHGGAMHFESAEGQGSTFRVRLPLETLTELHEEHTT